MAGIGEEQCSTSVNGLGHGVDLRLVRDEVVDQKRRSRRKLCESRGSQFS